MNGASVTVDSVCIDYGDARAVDNVSFGVPAGGCLAILGANGAGKSSLGKALVGLVSPCQGRIAIDDVNISRLPAHRLRRQGVGYLPEGRGIFPSLTVEENIRLGLRSISPPDRAAAAERLAAMFPVLGHRRNQVAGSLSGGEQQMLAIGRSLVGGLRLLVIDELSLGLAPRIVDEIFAALVTAQRSGVTIVLIEQYVARAVGFADAIVLMRRGRRVWEGPADEAENVLAAGYLTAERDS
jgi:branched-chain amino acid transport system ATP-binding protein